MNQLLMVWRSPKQLNIMILCALIYAACLIPFKGWLVIPDVSEIRPAAFLPIVFGILFGPAGAIGSALGNFVGDLFGTFSRSSIFGCFGNFIMSYLAYRIWLLYDREHPIQQLADRNTNQPLWRYYKKYLWICLLSTASSAVMIAFGVELFQRAEFLSTFVIILLNNLFFNIILGPFVAYFLFKFANYHNLLWYHASACEPYENTLGTEQWLLNWELPILLIFIIFFAIGVAFVRGEPILNPFYDGNRDLIVLVNSGILLCLMLFGIFKERVERKE